jgi:hypothetical protein
VDKESGGKRRQTDREMEKKVIGRAAEIGEREICERSEHKKPILIYSDAIYPFWNSKPFDSYFGRKKTPCK